MKEDANEPTPANETSPSNEFNRRLAVLKTEVDLDFPNLLTGLESGVRLVIFKNNRPSADLNPEVLRRWGGMLALCESYGAAVLIVDQRRILETED
jgi:hypothetical protein